LVLQLLVGVGKLRITGTGAIKSVG
jgi:hypothetical protein